jgi:hypothetical protein
MNIVARLARHLRPVAEAGLIDRVVYDGLSTMQVYAAPHMNSFDSPMLRFRFADLLLIDVFRELPLESIRSLELGLVSRDPGDIIIDIVGEMRRFLGACHRLRKWETKNYFTFDNCISFLVPAAEGVMVPTLRHLSVDHNNLVDGEGRRTPECQALLDALIQRYEVLGITLSALVSDSAISDEVLQDLQEIAGESQVGRDGQLEYELDLFGTCIRCPRH